MPSWRSSLPHAAVPRREHVGVVAAPDAHLEPVQRELRPGQGERRERGDLVGPAEGGVEVAEALHEAEAVRLLAAAGLGAEEHGPRRPGAGEERQPLDRPVVDQQPELGGGDAEPGGGGGHPQVAGHGQLGARAERGAVDRGQVRTGVVAQRRRAPRAAGR